jgi:putative transposase
VACKARLCGARIVIASRWYPSSKTFSCCGVINPTLDLAESTFRGTNCGFEAGRNLNTALNLAGMAASSAVTACGAERSGARRLSRVKRASVKQEGNDDGMLKEAARKQLLRHVDAMLTTSGARLR